MKLQGIKYSLFPDIYYGMQPGFFFFPLQIFVFLNMMGVPLFGEKSVAEKKKKGCSGGRELWLCVMVS
jgi:hypothetical protein